MGNNPRTNAEEHFRPGKGRTTNCSAPSGPDQMPPLFRGIHPRLFTLFACGEPPPIRHAATLAAQDGQSLPCSLELPLASWPTATDQGKPGFQAAPSPPMTLCLRDFGGPKKSSKKDCHIRPENAYSTTGLLGSTRLGAPAALAGESHAMPFSSPRPMPVLKESRTGRLVVSRS